ncbi:MAG: hypothetical protein ACRDOA_05085 [Streptosporangiaceae bacterium]
MPIRGIPWLTAVAVFGLLLAGGTPASASSGTTIGPVQINPVGHPHLCWQATGNGAPILLETCDPAVEAQQWSLTPDGVLMNGIGYCLEARPGQPVGVPLFIDFASQCGGSRGQVWQYDGGSGHLSSLGTCAGLAGRVSAGISVVRRACPGGPRWSIGYSAVTLRRGSGSGAVGGAFDTSVTVANAAKAQTAYEVTVKFGLPRGLDYTGVHATGGASGWRCDRPTLTCAGTLPAGASGRIYLSGSVPTDTRPGTSYTLTARAVIGGTSQLPGTADQTVPATVAVHAAPPAPPAPAGLSGLLLLTGIVTVLLLGGGLLVGFTLRRRPARADGAPSYQGHRRQAAR